MVVRCVCPLVAGNLLAAPRCAGERVFEVDTRTAFLILKPAEIVPWCRWIIVYGASRLCSCPNRVSLFREHGL